jgi:hypothetical protein
MRRPGTLVIAVLPSRTPNVVKGVAPVMAAGAYTLRVTVVGSSDTQSTGTTVALDRVLIT